MNPDGRERWCKKKRTCGSVPEFCSLIIHEGRVKHFNSVPVGGVSSIVHTPLNLSALTFADFHTLETAAE